MAESCESCRFWLPCKPENPRGGSGGFCRRYPPKQLGLHVSHPITSPYTWCGEYRRELEA